MATNPATNSTWILRRGIAPRTGVSLKAHKGARPTCEKLAGRSVRHLPQLPAEAAYHEVAMAGFPSHRPDSATEANPFQPGTGKLPPYLAGRQPEQSQIRQSLEILTRRAAPAKDLILYGPRGNGKTALVEWSRREAIRLKVQVADLLGGDLLTVKQLVAALSAGWAWLDALSDLTPGPVGIRLGNLPPGPISSSRSRTKP